MNESQYLIQELNHLSYPLDNDADLDPLIERIGNARVILLGEASHGTSEYYTWRARLSRRLIMEKDFSFIAVEGDWPDCYRVNRYVKGYDDAVSNAYECLHAFHRWPSWMWANWEVVALTRWLYEINSGLSPKYKIGFYGLDVYSLWESMAMLQAYLKDRHPNLLKAVEDVVRCFEPYRKNEQQYARSTALFNLSCENEVVDFLTELRGHAQHFSDDEEGHFNAEQNAQIMVNAERYYRAMIQSNITSWNLRDKHMADTLERLLLHHGQHAKAIVWAHNTHIGDARATTMQDQGMFNIGQLTRLRYGHDAVALIGMGSHRGSVIAGRRWGDPMESMAVPGAKIDSWEDLFHRAQPTNQLLITGDISRSMIPFFRARRHRAIGVVYNPAHESYGNYVPTVMPERYDAFLFIDETQALHPLHLSVDAQSMPDTFPFGF